MPRARTRPGLVREALLDGQVYWESDGPRGFLQQWRLTLRNSHPLCMICKSHRLSPLTTCERRSEGIFQLLSGFAVLIVIQETLLLQNIYGADCALYDAHVFPQKLPSSEGYAPWGPQQSNDTHEAFPDVPVLGVHVQLSSFAVSILASFILTALMNGISACLAAIRAPCLRRWVDFPLKDSYGLHPSRSRGHREACSPGGSCSVLSPWCGRGGSCGTDGACARLAGTCSFQIFSIYVRATVLVGLLIASVALLFVRYRVDSDSSGFAVVEHDLLSLLSAYVQSLTVNHFGSSLALFLPLWLCADRCGARLGWAEFPLSFRMVMASNRVPFPEEAVSDTVARVPRVQRRVPEGPEKRTAGAVYTEFAGDSLRDAVDAAVARFDGEMASRDRFGRVLRLGRAVGGTVRRGLTAMNPIVAEAGAAASTAPAARPCAPLGAALADPLASGHGAGAADDEGDATPATDGEQIELAQLITDRA